jgi:amino acid transporter
MLKRRLNLPQCVSLNASMMVGIGPFLTIPLMVKEMRGPLVLVVLVIGAIVALSDGLVWSELAAAFPGSGGTYHFYDSVFGNSRAGRFLKFLFIWQFLFSAPLELASGAMGLTRYAGYFGGFLSRAVWSVRFGSQGTWTFTAGQALAMLVIAGLTLLAYRKVEATGRMMMALGLGMAATVLWVILAGLPRINPQQVFAASEWNWSPTASNLKSAGIALGLVMYIYLGYYQVCYLGDEVIDPARTIPRSILIASIGVAIAYVAMTVSILGVISWQTMPEYKDYVGSAFMRILYGEWAASLVTGLIIWTAAAGTFAAIIGYSRVPYAAAKSGHFFRGLAALHPKAGFPHRSLLLVGGLAIVACLADLEVVIQGLLTSRILIQFVGQVMTVLYIRTRPDLRAKLSFRMWLYPLPAIVALVGWLAVFASSGRVLLIYGLGSMLLGAGVFWIWDNPDLAKEVA